MLKHISNKTKINLINFVMIWINKFNKTPICLNNMLNTLTNLTKAQLLPTKKLKVCKVKMNYNKPVYKSIMIKEKKKSNYNLKKFKTKNIQMLKR